LRILTLILLLAPSIFAAFYIHIGHSDQLVKKNLQNFIELETKAPVPSLPLLSKDNRSVTLENLRGKFLLVNFWATWCAPCVKELPSLDRLNEKLTNKGFDVVLISQDLGGFSQTEKYLKKLNIKIKYTFIDEKLNFSRAAKVTAIPTTIFISPEGEEIGRLIGAIEWDNIDTIKKLERYKQKILAK